MQRLDFNMVLAVRQDSSSVAAVRAVDVNGNVHCLIDLNEMECHQIYSAPLNAVSKDETASQ